MADIDAKARLNMDDVTELVKRLNSHMGKAKMSEVLKDCRLAATALEALQAELEEARANEDDGLAWDALALCKDRAEALQAENTRLTTVMELAVERLERTMPGTVNVAFVLHMLRKSLSKEPTDG